MNDQERTMWVQNEEDLYNWWRSTRQSITVFVRENRKEIDQAIRLNREAC